MAGLAVTMAMGVGYMNPLEDPGSRGPPLDARRPLCLVPHTHRSRLSVKLGFLDFKVAHEFAARFRGRIEVVGDKHFNLAQTLDRAKIDPRWVTKCLLVLLASMTNRNFFFPVLVTKKIPLRSFTSLSRR